MEPRKLASQVKVGDLIRIERRYVVNGNLTSMTDSGTYQGIEAFGTSEHIVIDDSKEVRLIPLNTISEITLLVPGESNGTEDGTGSYIM